MGIFAPKPQFCTVCGKRLNSMGFCRNHRGPIPSGGRLFDAYTGKRVGASGRSDIKLFELQALLRNARKR